MHIHVITPVITHSPLKSGTTSPYWPWSIHWSAAADIWKALWIIDQHDADWSAVSHEMSALRRSSPGSGQPDPSGCVTAHHDLDKTQMGKFSRFTFRISMADIHTQRHIPCKCSFLHCMETHNRLCNKRAHTMKFISVRLDERWTESLKFSQHPRTDWLKNCSRIPLRSKTITDELCWWRTMSGTKSSKKKPW